MTLAFFDKFDNLYEYKKLKIRTIFMFTKFFITVALSPVSAEFGRSLEFHREKFWFFNQAAETSLKEKRVDANYLSRCDFKSH